MTRTLWVALAALMLAFAGCAGNGGDQENPRATMETNHGNITILLYGNMTPQTVQNFGELAQEGVYDDTRFHRVIADFMIQGGDPLTQGGENESRWGSGGPGYTIEDEFACEDGTVSNDFQGYDSDEDPCEGHGGLALTHEEPGMVSMANTGQPRTGGSQFFITAEGQPSLEECRENPRLNCLDGTHPVFGEVVEGMDVVQEINQVETDDRDRPVDDVIVHDVTIEGELPGVEVDKFNQG